ncbi:MAG: hypothetical protein H0S79_17165 [Anaerolineaceae bacterium]|nr:hypothetical protein [Anaerolineaceae bacterium]
MKSKVAVMLVALMAGMFFGCSPAPTPTLEPEDQTDYQIQVADVSVTAGDQVALVGTTTLPEGNCVYTQLVQEDTSLEWWPVGKCFPVSSPEWTFAIPLGVEGTPDDLDREANYCIRVWWPGAPSITLAEFHFTLPGSSAP